MTLGERLWEAQRAARPERVIGFVQASSDARLKKWILFLLLQQSGGENQAHTSALCQCSDAYE